MKKALLLIFALCSLVWLQVEASSNGTIVNGQYMVQDFEGFTLSQSLEMANIYGGPIVGTATVVANPTQSSQKVAHIVMTNSNYNTLLKLNVTLPAGKSMRDFTHISFDLYRLASGDANNKQMHISVDGTQIYQDANYIQQANLITWTTKTYAIPVSAPTANSFVMLLGIKTDNGNHMLDNIRLSYNLTTPTAVSADDVNSNSFTAKWNALFGVENYRLDVATDAAFTNMVSGYNNLNVGNVTSFNVSGLDDNTTYYYRVRGAKSDGTSPSSGTITVTTLSGDSYVLPNLDPTPEADPIPGTITGESIFVIADYEANAINDVLLLNSAHATSSATVKADPANASNKAAHVIIKNYGLYYRLIVTLPPGKVFADYQKLSFNYYLNGTADNTNKNMEARINGAEWKSSSATNNLNQWLLMEFNVDNHAAGNTFNLDLGFNTNNGDFFIDNVKLIPSNPIAAATTATTATHINATSFKAQWSLYQGSTAYFLDVSTNSGFSSFVSGYENLNVGDVSNYVVSGLTANTTYYYRVRGTNTSSNSNTITVATKAGTTATSHFATRASGNISDIAIWQSSLNNTGWMNATAAPSGTAKSIRVLKDHELTVDDDFEGAEIIVRAGGKLKVASGKTLELSGRLFLESSAEGTATLVNEGTVTVTGDAVVKQHLTSGRNWYFASPVSNATSEVIIGTSGNQLWQRNVAGNNWTEVTGTTAELTPGRGYIAKVAETGVLTFTGALNTGQVQYPISSHTVTSGKFHLVGNPYPSYLDWQSVVTANADVMPTMWFRTKTSSNTYMFATVLMSDGDPIISAVNASTTVTKFIPPMQAFWVRIKDNVENTSFTVNNTMRSHADLSGNRFKAPANQHQLLRLDISNGTNNDEAVLYFNANASDAFDRYDSPKMFNNNAAIPEIYTRAGNERLVINGMNGYNYNTMIPLGFNTGQAGSFSIRASQLQNFDSDTQVYLLDKTSNKQFNLSEGEAYSFTSDATSSEDRFAVLFKSASGTSSVEDGAAAGMYLTAQNGRLTLQMHTAMDNARVTVFTASGQNIHSQDILSPTTVLSKTLEAGVYVVKMVNGGRTTVLRTIIN